MGRPSPSPRALLALCLLVSAPSARAESGRAPREVDPRNLDATSSPASVIGLATSAVARHLTFYGGLTASWARDELVLRGATRDLADPLTDRLVSTLGLGVGLLDVLELELALPFHVSAPAGAAGGTAAGLGDTHLTLRWRVLGAGAGAGPGFGLGLHLGLGLPTGGAAPFSSDAGPSLDPRLVADWRGADGTTLVAQVGYRARPAGGVLDLALGDELRFGAGLELPFGALGAPVPASLLAEVEGAVGLATASFDPHGAGTARKRPLELRLGLRWRGPPWTVTVATGTGLGGGYGTPDHRVLLALGWSSGPSPVPAPPARVDRLATSAAPEPRPDFGPGLESGLAGDDPGGPTPDADAEAALDAALAADPDPDGDGVVAAHDACPEAREDLDGHADADGCPDPDDDQDGVLDAADRCPTEREVLNGVLDEDGCPDEGAETIVAGDDTIELDQTIEFRSGSDVLAPSAAPILAQLARVLVAHPEVERVRIEGHTDAEGHPEQNVDLSERRAARVRAELVRLGIAPTRLVPKGFGATRPVASNANAAGRQRNRRVELHILREASPAPREEEAP